MRPERSVDNLDRVLAAEEELVPSSGFVAAVMERVREEVAAPEPIAFPWRRVLPGAVVAAIGLVWCVIQLVRMSFAALDAPTLVPLQTSVPLAPRTESVAWVAGALAMSAIPWLLARRMMGRRGLV